MLTYGAGRLALAIVVAATACGGDDDVTPITGEAARARLEAIAAEDPRVELSDAYDYFLTSCEENYGTFRGADEEGFGLDLGHRAATDAEVNDLVGVVALTAAMCPEYAEEVGKSADLALASAQRGNRDPLTSKTLKSDIGGRFVVIADSAIPADEARG